MRLFLIFMVWGLTPAFAEDAGPRRVSVKQAFIDHYFSGTEYHRKGDLSRAETEYLKARGLDPENPVILNLLGRLYMQKGDPERAIRMLEETLRHCSSGKPVLQAHWALGDIYLSEKRYKRALSEFEECLRLDLRSKTERLIKSRINTCKTGLNN